MSDATLPGEPASSPPLTDVAGPAAGSPRPGRRLLASSATVSMFNGLGVVAGFVLDAVIMASFGLGSQTDAFFSAWRLPNLITVVLGMAASATLVPLFSRVATAGHGEDERGEGPHDEGSNLALSVLFSRVFNALLLLMVAVAILGVLLSPLLVSRLYAGLPEASQALAASLSRVLFLTLLFTGAVEVFRAFLYGHQVFAVPTAINFVRSTVVIAVLVGGRLLLGRQVATDWAGLHLLAWGYVAGVAAQLLVVGWQAWRHTSLRWQPLFDLRDPQLRDTVRRAAAPTGGALVRQAINLAETMIASYLPAGSVTVLNYAYRLAFVLSSVFLSSITTASMPMLSRSIGLRQWQVVRRTLLSALRLVVFLAVPLGVGLAALGVPVIRLLFERGRFDANASQLTGTVLSFYALSILFLGYFRVVQAYFYAALKAHVVLALFGLLALSAIGLDLVLARRVGVWGIAVGFSTGTLLVTGVGLWLLAREVGGRGLDTDAVVRDSAVRVLVVLNVKVGLAAVMMAGTARVLLRLLPDATGAMLLSLAAGGAAFVVAAWLLRIDELRMAWDLLRSS